MPPNPHAITERINDVRNGQLSDLVTDITSGTMSPEEMREAFRTSWAEYAGVTAGSQPALAAEVPLRPYLTQTSQALQQYNAIHAQLEQAGASALDRVATLRRPMQALQDSVINFGADLMSFGLAERALGEWGITPSPTDDERGAMNTRALAEVLQEHYSTTP